MAAQSLKQHLAELAEKHDLLSVSITLHQAPDRAGRKWFNAGVQWRDETEDHGRGISSATADTPEVALKEALAGAISKRLNVEALPELAT